MGAVQFVQVTEDIQIANMLAQNGLFHWKGNPKPIDYSAVESALRLLTWRAARQKATIHMPRIGCGLARGKWEEVEPLIKKAIVQEDVSIYVYDLPKT